MRSVHLLCSMRQSSHHSQVSSSLALIACLNTSVPICPPTPGPGCCKRFSMARRKLRTCPLLSATSTAVRDSGHSPKIVRSVVHCLTDKVLHEGIHLVDPSHAPTGRGCTFRSQCSTVIPTSTWPPCFTDDLLFVSPGR